MDGACPVVQAAGADRPGLPLLLKSLRTFFLLDEPTNDLGSVPGWDRLERFVSGPCARPATVLVSHDRGVPWRRPQ